MNNLQEGKKKIPAQIAEPSNLISCIFPRRVGHGLALVTLLYLQRIHFG